MSIPDDGMHVFSGDWPSFSRTIVMHIGYNFSSRVAQSAREASPAPFCSRTLPTFSQLFARLWPLKNNYINICLLSYF